MSRLPGADRFAGFTLREGCAVWPVPMTAANTMLEYGSFADLNLDKLRPVRDRLGVAVTQETHDGLLRGPVRVDSGSVRHVNVTARHALGFRGQLDILAVSPGPHRLLFAVMGKSRAVRVTGVRAVRLASYAAEPAGTAWTARADVMGQAIEDYPHFAGRDWDYLLERHRPVQQRYRFARNPWLWLHSLAFE